MTEKSITRRDLLNGMAFAGTALLVPGCRTTKGGSSVSGDESLAPAGGETYPPALTGMRGSHPGAYENAHALAGVIGEKKDFGPPIVDSANYDLIVIGAGISGLSSAYYYRKNINPRARILILDNHDDFGGHAKRNEFTFPTMNGKPYISYGGTQAIDNPTHYSQTAKDLLVDLGINVDTFKTAYDKNYFVQHGMGQGVFFDKSTFGENKLVQCQPPRVRGVHTTVAPGLKPTPEISQVLSDLPLTEDQKKVIANLTGKPPQAAFDYFSAENGGSKRLYTNNYVEFLRDVYNVTDPALVTLLSMPLSDDYAVGGTSVVLWDAVDGGLYGLPPRTFFPDEFGPDDHADEYIYHFPDGNATIARLLVHRLIPQVAEFNSVEECLVSRFKYSALDQPANDVAIRLSSLAVNARNVTDPETGKSGTSVQYIRDGKLYESRATHTVMAGWHMMAAHIIPSLPQAQKDALRANIKMPLVYAEVALHQWKPIQQAGIGTAFCPGSYFQWQYADYPVKMGSFQPNREPDAPTAIIMIRMPIPILAEGSPADLFRFGRWDLLSTPFESFEANIRKQLTDMYGRYGFDADRDIAAITVNRWSHGYIYWHNVYDDKPAHETARMRHGNITIANSDAAGDAYSNAAIDMAWRAVDELRAPNNPNPSAEPPRDHKAKVEGA